MGVGVFHSGLEVFGTEYAYGGHPFSFSGIFQINPKDADDLGDHYKYKYVVWKLIPTFSSTQKFNCVLILNADKFFLFVRESILLGHTSFTKDEVDQAVSHLGRDFKGINYHLMNKNCNHFSSELSQVRNLEIEMTSLPSFLIKITNV